MHRAPLVHEFVLEVGVEVCVLLESEFEFDFVQNGEVVVDEHDDVEATEQCSVHLQFGFLKVQDGGVEVLDGGRCDDGAAGVHVAVDGGLAHTDFHLLEGLLDAGEFGLLDAVDAVDATVVEVGDDQSAGFDAPGVFVLLHAAGQSRRSHIGLSVHLNALHYFT